jgi:hypothetical protein
VSIRPAADGFAASMAAVGSSSDKRWIKKHDRASRKPRDPSRALTGMVAAIHSVFQARIRGSYGDDQTCSVHSEP